jgi:hypothetical protein
MKTDKEYPATHSMSTAWYMSDEDGNVGIMEFNESGPVPWGIGDYDLTALVLGTEDGLKIDLTDEQIFELLGEPYPKDKISWSFCIIQIEPSRTDEFLRIVKGNSYIIYQCISKKLGLYDIWADRYVTKDNEIIPRSPLDIIIKKNLIVNVYKSFSSNFFETDDDSDDDDHTEFDSAPYYIYKQSYWVNELQKRLIEPKYPVKLHQLPKELRKKTLRLPIRFEDAKFLQIAEWYPSYGYSNKTAKAYGCDYRLWPIKEGEEAYCLNTLLSGSDKQSERLAQALDSVSRKEFCAYPTVVVFHSPAWHSDYDILYDYSDITAHSLHLSYMSFDSVYSACSYLDDRARQRIVQSSSPKELFRQNTSLFEYVLNRFRPNLVIVDDSEIDIISSVYTIEDHLLVTPDYQSPIYAQSEVEANRAMLTELAERPYQGDYYPLVISVDKMKEINPELNEKSENRATVD